MFSTKLISDIDPQELYFGAVRDNKNQKQVFISRKDGSSDQAHNLVFQLAPNHRDMVPRSKFGVDRLQEDNTNPYKRSVSLTMEDPNLVTFIQAIENKVIQMAVSRSAELWGREMDQALVRDRFQSVIKPAPADQPGLKPLLKVKFNVLNPEKKADEQPQPSAFFIVEEEIAPCDEYPGGHLSCVKTDDPVLAIEKNSKILPTIKVTQVWKSGFGFGITCTIVDALVWPGTASRTIADNMHLDGAAITIKPAHKRQFDAAFDD